MLVVRGRSAVSNYHIDTWQADAGLPQGTVTSIVQTPDGYLWLGTQNGLARFDGVSFTVFNQDNTPAFSNNRIVQLFVDHLGILWISAEQGNLVRFQNGKFTAYEIPGKDTPFNYARDFCDDTDGNLWLVSCEWQLLSLGEKGFTVWSTNWNLKGTMAAAVANDLSGNVWVQTEAELATFQTGAFQPKWNETNEANFHVDLGKSREGGIWVAP